MIHPLTQIGWTLLLGGIASGLFDTAHAFGKGCAMIGFVVAVIGIVKDRND